ncbi:glycine cleavage system protein T [Ammoniphilus oxalaticus]|uniref:Aminomethyltransferase n=1 Tax=Ammoniphilus oxalaticus TaxID=66863 RepID=A0A419SMR3_9BACL|nr:glycine cleavage system aminomethyltransferase GcvT [Ammoniphilus oxalaticus]RKD25533.1 glycine cleavage system protein T [Ammoniphilus oxalaticus]
MSELKRTPLYPVYEKYGAKTVDFGGWALPVQFSSIKAEHQAVREAAGLFDVSHMGEVEVKGPDALTFLQRVTTNDVARLAVGQAQYTFMCYPDGGTVDDLLIYKKADNDYMLVINASNIDKDIEWLTHHQAGDVVITNISSEMALLAIQGPKAETILAKLTNEDLSEIGFFRFKQNVEIAGSRALVSRTGYTGEDGFEIYCQSADALSLWERILQAGEADGLLPCGLGARDTLRFEVTLPLYGQELSLDISPLEAGLGFAVKVDKESPFIGQEALRKQKEAGVARKLVGIEMIDRGIPRTGYPVYLGEKQVGEITSGTQSTTLKKNIGLALVKTEALQADGELAIEIRGRRLKAQLVPIPFYRRPS